jgi:glycosyltransferase involved in cell wall biosynthesis
LSRPVYKLGLRNVDQVVALSNYTKKLLEQEGFQVAYVPNGAELLPFSPSRKDTSCLLYAGRLEKYKGVDDLLRAIPKIQAKIPHVHVEIAGDGTFKSELVQLVQQLHLEKCVTFLGQLSAQHLAAAYVRSSIFVLPSTWPETFGKVGIEAMSTGRPVIATDVGGVTDWLEDGSNGFLVQPRRPEQIADRATILLSDHKLAVQMTHAARRTAERFSIAQMNAHIERLITEVRDRL